MAVGFWPGAGRRLAPALAVAMLAAAGCSGPAAGHRVAQGAAAYWDRTRLLGALPFGLASSRLRLPGQTADSRTAGPRAGLRVGAL